MHCMHYAMAEIAHCPSHHVLPSLARMVSDMANFESGDLDTITCAVISYGVMLLLSLAALQFILKSILHDETVSKLLTGCRTLLY